MGLKERVFLKSDGRMTVPVKIRKRLELTSSSVLEMEIYGTDKILITILAK